MDNFSKKRCHTQFHTNIYDFQGDKETYNLHMISSGASETDSLRQRIQKRLNTFHRIGTDYFHI